MISRPKNGKIKLTKNILDAISHLFEVDKNDFQTFLNFFNTFGTNFITKASFGAKSLIESKFKRNIYEILLGEKFSFESAARASFFSFTGSVSLMTETDKILAQQFDSHRTSFSQIFIGAAPSRDGIGESWAQIADDSPVPIDYDLEYIYELIDPQYIDEVDKNRLDLLQNTMKKHLKDYCFEMVGSRCYGPQPELPFPKYTLLSKEGALNIDLRCPDNYYVSGGG